jgi:hypothetical protein
MGKMFQNASSLKPLGQLKPNCPGMIIGRSSTKFLFFYDDRKFKMAATAGHRLTLESTISSKRLPVSTFKDAVRLSPTDDYYLVTDSEGNIGNMRFLRPIPEPQVTEPELLQENKNGIVGNKILHCGKLMDMFNKFYKEHGQNELLCNWNTNNCQKWGLS